MDLADIGDSKKQVLPEIGARAAWSLSSAKPGFGVSQIRNNNLDTYWQSDGPQPHTINIQWLNRMEIEEIALYVDYSIDESYTPRNITIQGGTNEDDLQPITSVELVEPHGWYKIKITKDLDENKYRMFYLQIAITSNHQNGRDSHLREVRVYGPRRDASGVVARNPTERSKSSKSSNTTSTLFHSVENSMFQTLR
eukprot:TRINITY_DN2441_c0_g1_i1.p1 TRINITY_DN2441_c0_g1~~TRINITY_DN2441_c0_g1_i1.p1  ORF type:complete len:196 (-),score=17.23 TRINITY_DN2441_c0_g1_i1:169-756(-)